MKMSSFSRIAMLCLCFGVASVSSLYAQADGAKAIQGTYTTIYDMLSNVPGLEVKMGSGGKSSSVVVRGMGTLTGSGAPLVVVNGVIYGGDLGSINPQDVSNISVSKDAASNSVYGSQGSNGVIQITLKNGTKPTATAVVQHEESAYKYFIDHKTSLRVFGLSDEVLIEGPIVRQQDSTLVFIKKRKEVLIPIGKVKRVEMVPEN